MALQGEMLINIQVKVVERHRSLMHYAHLTGITDKRLFSWQQQHRMCGNLRQASVAVQGEMLVNSQAKVVELHRSLMHHARLTGITDEGLLVSNSNLVQDLEASKQYSHRCDE